MCGSFNNYRSEAVEIRNNWMSNMYIYHYCSNDTFYKIIHGRELRMTDISRSNDYEEMSLFFPAILDEIEEMYKAEPFDFQYGNTEGLPALQCLFDRIYRNTNGKRKQGFLTSYVACFSSEMDLLSQWRGYADNAKGCAIGFSVKELENYCARSNGVIAIKEIKYIKEADLKLVLRDKAKELIQKLFSLRVDAYNLFKYQRLNEEEIEEIMFLLYSDIIEDLLFDSLRYKRSDFREEKEWRIFFRSITKDGETLFADKDNIPSRKEKFDKDYQSQHNKIEFYAKVDCISPYFPLKLEEVSANPIKKVVLGPLNRSYLQDIKLLFEKEKLGKPDVVYSRISYR